MLSAQAKQWGNMQMHACTRGGERADLKRSAVGDPGAKRQGRQLDGAVRADGEFEGALLGGLARRADDREGLVGGRQLDEQRHLGSLRVVAHGAARRAGQGRREVNIIIGSVPVSITAGAAKFARGCEATVVPEQEGRICVRRGYRHSVQEQRACRWLSAAAVVRGGVAVM